nr:integrase arm-type DNA-binding domain-containing protein [Novosphingopyxis sp. YJ-S2-01]
MTEIQCRSAKAELKPKKHSDSGGLFLLVTPTGLKSWRWKYYFRGKEKKLVLGRYPAMSLKQARAARDDARELLGQEIDPGEAKKERRAKAATAVRDTFNAAADEWLNRKAPGWTAGYAKKMTEQTENARKAFGSRALRDITPVMVLNCITAIQSRNAPTMANRVLQFCSDIFALAIATQRAEQNPAKAVRGALIISTTRNRPAELSIEKARQTIRKIERVEDAWWATLLASWLTALTAVRPGVVRQAERSEFEQLNGEAPLWRIPAAKMKQRLAQKNDARFEFRVPLSRQAVETVKAAKAASPSPQWLFPSIQAWRQPIDANKLSEHYRSAGLRGKMVPHGWRATFSTIMNELASEDGRDGDHEIIDLMLAHVRGGTEGAYNRASYMQRRRILAQMWSDLLMDGLPPPGALTPD